MSKYDVKLDGNTSNNISILIVVFFKKNMVGSLNFYDYKNIIIFSQEGTTIKNK